MTAPGRDREPDSNEEAREHGGDLAPGVYPPPEPAKEVDQPGAGADRENQVECSLGRIQGVGEQRGADHQQRGRHPAGEDIVPFRRIGTEKAPVEVVDQVGRTPVEVGLDGRAIRRQHPGDHEAEESHGEEPEHGGVGHVVPDEFRIHVGKSPGDIAQLGVDHRRAQRHQDPGPGPEGVVHDVEEHRAAPRRPSRCVRPASAGRCSCPRRARPRGTTPTTIVP